MKLVLFLRYESLNNHIRRIFRSIYGKPATKGARKNSVRIAFAQDTNTAFNQVCKTHQRWCLRTTHRVCGQHLQSVFYIRRWQYCGVVQWVSEKDTETPQKEIDKAIEIKEDYYAHKRPPNT